MGSIHEHRRACGIGGGMTSYDIDHHGDDVRNEVGDDRFVMLRLDDTGTWTVEADMSMVAVEVLASLDIATMAPDPPSGVAGAGLRRVQ